MCIYIYIHMHICTYMSRDSYGDGSKETDAWEWGHPLYSPAGVSNDTSAGGGANIDPK